MHERQTQQVQHCPGRGGSGGWVGAARVAKYFCDGSYLKAVGAQRNTEVHTMVALRF